MANKKIARLINNRCHFKCESCDDTKFNKMYEYQNISFVKGFVPHHFKQICGDCIYKKVYGTKFYQKKKKEGALDGKVQHL